jgi:hypothetical protein
VELEGGAVGDVLTNYSILYVSLKYKLDLQLKFDAKDPSLCSPRSL